MCPPTHRLELLIANTTTTTAGVVLGVAFLLTWAVSIGAIIQPLHVTLGLVILNWILLVDALAVIVVGTTLWFYTLQERMNYHEVYAAVSAQTRLSIQDKVCLYRAVVDMLVDSLCYRCNAAGTSIRPIWSRLEDFARTRRSWTRQ